jgi:VCBS repeat-containing protein
MVASRHRRLERPRHLHARRLRQLTDNAAAIQRLGAGQTLTDSFIAGADDAAAIGVPSDAAVTGDESTPTLTATGTIGITDPDQDQASFKAAASTAGNLGSLRPAANGGYTYAVANGAVQHLGAGLTKVETFTVESQDGTAKQVSLTINGVNDLPASPRRPEARPPRPSKWPRTSRGAS